MSHRWQFRVIFGGLVLAAGLILTRLAYWQLIAGEQLALVAKNQYWRFSTVSAARGKILACDGFPLVENKKVYLVFALPQKIKAETKSLSIQLAAALEEDQKIIEERLKRRDLNWVLLKRKVGREIKEKMEVGEIEGLGFAEEMTRSYPEGSLAAQLLGFVVAMDTQGRSQGYFGLEGKYDLELKGKDGWSKREKDVLNRPILIGEAKEEKAKNGRDLLTTLDRGVQFLLEERLQKGVERYGAKSGSTVVMEPKTGAILGMASTPNYDPANYEDFEKSLYVNPVVAKAYEPGSIFKVLVMAAALDAGVVEPQTKCQGCAGPRKFGSYTVRTWNDKYYPDSSMVEILQHSDNVGMIFVEEKLGKERFLDYLKKFGIGEKTGIDLQDESLPWLRADNQWQSLDLATASFGQGIAVTSMQMLRAVGALANNGRMMKPFIVQEVRGENEISQIKPVEVRQVLKPETAKMITEMMVNAVDQGEAKWAKPKGYRIAGKTGTAQVAIAGHYDPEKTVASFVGFAPADEPRFVMLTTLEEPISSPWGSETAAPLWFEIAKELFTYYGISP